MDTTKLNVKHISKIRVIEKEQDDRYVWIVGTRFLWFTVKTGFFWALGGRYGSYIYTSPEEVANLRHRYVEDKKVFYKPHIEIITTDGKTTTFWFDTMREIIDFLNKEEFKEATWITYP